MTEKVNISSLIENRNGQILVDAKEKMRWKAQVQFFFDDNSLPQITGRKSAVIRNNEAVE